MKQTTFLIALLIAALTVPALTKEKDKEHDKERDRERKEEKRSRSDTKETSSRSDHTSSGGKSSSKEHSDAGATGSSKSPAPSLPTTPSAGYDAFRYVRGRNIFDPNRRGLRLETPGGTTTASSSPRGRSLALTGTMVTEGKALAFFGGSAAEGSRVIAAGSTVAGYTVTAIAATQVSLEREGKTIALNIGRQMTFDSGSGEASVSSGPVIEAAAPPTTEATGVPSLPGLSGDKAEILKRMMERRAKEVGK